MAVEQLVLRNPVAVGGREDGDHFATPRWCVDALVAYLGRTPSRFWHTVDRVLDPACGEGSILDVCRTARRTTYGYELNALRAEEARSRGHTIGVGDALARKWAKADALVMNPPYNLAVPFLRAAMAWREEQDVCASVYSLHWSSFDEPTEDRRELLLTHTPDKLILPRRVRFAGKGTPREASAWFAWPGKGRMVWLP